MQDNALLSNPAFAELLSLQQQQNAQLQAIAPNPLLFRAASTNSGHSQASPNPFLHPQAFQRLSEAHLPTAEVAGPSLQLLRMSGSSRLPDVLGPDLPYISSTSSSDPGPAPPLLPGQRNQAAARDMLTTQMLTDPPTR
jgi:hypothetical protein